MFRTTVLVTIRLYLQLKPHKYIAVSIRVILYPMELRIRLVTIVLDVMPTATASLVRVVVTVASVTVTRVIIPATVTPVFTTHTIHVVLMLGIITSFTCKHSVTAWFTVTRVMFMCINICMILIAVVTREDVVFTVCILTTV
jgi:hypothetical protein